ncbi:tetratricopeptide repeat protein [Desulfatibacillum aliphaticivorans]|nr:tetratricopeptide repeat protein [Desulfatibacillum aliphaticivorans]
MPRYKFKNLMLAVMAFALLVPGVCFAKADSQESLPLSVRQILYKAYTAMNENKPGEAAALLCKFKQNPKNAKDMAEARTMVEFAEGNGRYMAKDYKGAMACFEQAVKSDPNYSAAWSNMAVLCHEMGDTLRAAQCFLQAYNTAEEKKPDLLYSAAAAFLMTEQYADSIAAFERLFTEFPQQVTNQWREYAVHAYLGSKQPRKALRLVEYLAVNTEGNEWRRWNEFLLHQYLDLEMNKKALSLVERLVDKEPGDPLWWKALANLHLSENRLEEGLMALWAYGKITPWNEEEQKLAADLFLVLDVPAEAVAILELLPEKELTASLVRQGVYCYRRMQQTGKAIALLDKHAYRLKDKELTILRADIFYESGNFCDACEAYERAAKEGCSPGRAWLMAGYSALAHGDKNKANHAFQKAMTFQSHSREAKNMLKRLS